MEKRKLPGRGTSQAGGQQGRNLGDIKLLVAFSKNNGLMGKGSTWGKNRDYFWACRWGMTIKDSNSRLKGLDVKNHRAYCTATYVLPE